ncbi:MAG: hypothetical protein AABZ53_06965 [Planctomycetota bacterium]
MMVLDGQAFQSIAVIETADGFVVGPTDEAIRQSVDFLGTIYSEVRRYSLVVFGCDVVLSDVGSYRALARDDARQKRLEAARENILDQLTRVEFHLSNDQFSYHSGRTDPFILVEGTRYRFNPPGVISLAVTLVLSYLALLTIGLVLVHARFRLLKYQQLFRARRGHCPACNYDLNASPLAPCPECGLASPLSVLGQTSPLPTPK